MQRWNAHIANHVTIFTFYYFVYFYDEYPFLFVKPISYVVFYFLYIYKCIEIWFLSKKKCRLLMEDVTVPVTFWKETDFRENVYYRVTRMWMQLSSL
jgi:hypothetical protein